MTTINYDRDNQMLTLTHTTEDGYHGILVVPTDPFSRFAMEVVTAPSGYSVHEAHVPIPETIDVVGMVLSARQNFRRVS